MIKYHNLDRVVWNVINEGKKECGIDSVSLGLRLGEFEVEGEKTGFFILVMKVKIKIILKMLGETDLLF